MPPEVVVDPEDLELLQNYGWFSVSTAGYCYCIDSRKVIYLHRLITGAADSKLLVDHINGNKLDNRKENLRLVSALDNVLNKPTKKGYTFDKSCNKFKAQIRINGNLKNLGRFTTAEEAEAAYRAAELELYPEANYEYRHKT